MKFIQRLADGYWVSGQTNGFDLYTGWVDVVVENLNYEKKVMVDFNILQSSGGQEMMHQVEIPAEFKESLLENKERWGCHTPEFLPVMEMPGFISYTKEAAYQARLIVDGQEIRETERHILFSFTPPDAEIHQNTGKASTIEQPPAYTPESVGPYDTLGFDFH